MPPMAKEWRDFVSRAKSKRPDVVVFEVQQPEEDGDHPINFGFHTDVRADVQEAMQEAMEALIRTPENLKKLADFGLPHKFYPSDVIVGFDTDGEGNFLVSISSRNSTFSR